MKLIYWLESLCLCDVASSKAGQSYPSLPVVFLLFFFFNLLLCCFLPPLFLSFFLFSSSSFFLLHQNVVGLNRTCSCFYRELALLYPALAVWLHTGSAAFKSALPFKTAQARAKNHTFSIQKLAFLMSVIKAISIELYYAVKA